MPTRLALVTVLICSQAQAQAVVRGEAAAKEYSKKALDAYKAGDFEAALTNYERAYELNPDPKYRLNMALANEGLSRLDDARVHYDAFLKEYPLHERAPLVKQKLKELERTMSGRGKVLIVIQPQPDSVEFAGKTFKRVPIPVWMEEGSYPLRVTREGYETQEQRVEVQKGSRFEVSITLRPAAVSPPVAVAPPVEPAKPPVLPDPVMENPYGAQNPKPDPAPAPPAEAKGGSGGILRLALRGLGGGSLLAAVPFLTISLLGGVTAVGILSAFLFVTGTDPYATALAAGMYGGAVVGVLSFLVFLGAAVLGGGMLGASFLIPE